MKKIILAAGILLLAGPAFAEPFVGDGFDGSRAQTPPPMDWLTILYFIAICVFVGGVAFRNARRTHLD
jgi:hypothetical protein